MFIYKKRVAILVAILMIISLSACKSEGSFPDESTPSDPSAPSAWETPSSSQPEVSTEAPTINPTDTPTPSTPDLPTPSTPETPPIPHTPLPAPPIVLSLTDEAFWRRVDGSTATIPMSFALFESFAESDNWPNEVIYHSRTHKAYQNLLNKEADIIFVTEPSAEAQKLFDDAGVEIDVIPIVKDAFVLLVNDRNPVRNLTQDQLRNIYSGKITNWKSVGGEDEEITPYQRGNTSGSQTLFLSLLMRDTEPMLAPMGYYIADMGGVIDAVSDYVNGKSSIGFSVFYYAYAMYGNDNVRFLEVDGVLPTEESIIGGEYPLESCYYAVLRKSTPIDHPARELVSWILSDAGQSLMQKTGYVPLRALDTPIDWDEIKPRGYGYWDDHLYGIGAELSNPLREMGVFSIPRKLDSGVFYSHPITTSEKVNALLDDFFQKTISKTDFRNRMEKNIHEHGVPFLHHTLPWKNFLTCVIYFGEGSPYGSFYLYADVEDNFDIYASICIDTDKGQIITPDVIVNALLKLEYMEGAKTVYERAGGVYWFWDTTPPDHIPSENHIITALWVNSEQAIVIELTDQGKTYRYGICTNEHGYYAGP